VFYTGNPFFTPLELPETVQPIPTRFELHKEPIPVCLLAATHLQEYLKHQTDWKHNFGLSPQDSGKIVGKMFGVLIVKNMAGEIGYLAAFSGKLAGGNHHPRFVPPIFDTLEPNNFVNRGMRILSTLSKQIRELNEDKSEGYQNKIDGLKQARHKHSNSLQEKIFDQYFFLNKAGESKSLRKIFAKANYKNPPSGAGECAGPKLLQYAFQQQMEPIALTEFWWGMSPKSEQWQHGHFYPCCEEKCSPILQHMLDGITR
jgi:tRNA pseudouridine32 synthase/23S rRNA pseudouridine746 synthase